jgi:hypothetical protein
MCKLRKNEVLQIRPRRECFYACKKPTLDCNSGFPDCDSSEDGAICYGESQEDKEDCHFFRYCYKDNFTFNEWSKCCKTFFFFITDEEVSWARSLTTSEMGREDRNKFLN